MKKNKNNHKRQKKGDMRVGTPAIPTCMALLWVSKDNLTSGREREKLGMHS